MVSLPFGLQLAYHRAMLARLLSLLIGCALTLQASAQAFPTKPIRLLVGYPPGGSGDFTTRIIAAELTEDLGVAVVVENRPGAGGNIAAQVVATSAPDGYTLLNGNNHAINLTLYKNPGYRDEDFAPITKVAAGPTVIVVNKDSPFKTLRELIDYAKANPGKLFNAGAGYGSAPHLAAALFEAVAGVKFTSVQFKGGGPAAQSLIAGDTQVMFATSPTVTGFIQGGRMRPLAVSKRIASPAIPGIPGAEEAGLPNYEYTFWFGLYAPAGTPVEVVRRLHAAAVKGLAKPEVQKRIASQGMDAAPFPSPEAFAADIKAEAPKLVKIIQDAGAKVE
jgi:tripartite-type tricarboxylate transporter receptor subunit TctC